MLFISPETLNPVCMQLHHRFAHIVTRPLDNADRKPRIDWSRFHQTLEVPAEEVCHPLLTVCILQNTCLMCGVAVSTRRPYGSAVMLKCSLEHVASVSSLCTSAETNLYFLHQLVSLLCAGSQGGILKNQLAP